MFFVFSKKKKSHSFSLIFKKSLVQFNIFVRFNALYIWMATYLRSPVVDLIIQTFFFKAKSDKKKIWLIKHFTHVTYRRVKCLTVFLFWQFKKKIFNISLEKNYKLFWGFFIYNNNALFFPAVSLLANIKKEQINLCFKTTNFSPCMHGIFTHF